MTDETKPSLDGKGNITNVGFKKFLPPGIQSNQNFGQFFMEVGDLKWLTYDGVNFLQDYGKGKKVNDLYARIKFWGEDPKSRGIFLKFKNGMKTKRETAVFKYMYQIQVPEPSFEQYVDDMGAIIIDFYSPIEGLTIGTSKIILKLYMKREKAAGDLSPLIGLRGTFPITLTGNQSVKIGEFELSMTSSFADPNLTQIPSSLQNINNNQNSNEDSFEMNEQNAERMAQMQNQKLHEQMNPDNRIASSLQNRQANYEAYDKNRFDDPHAQMRPTRDKPRDLPQNTQNSNNLTGKQQDLNFGSRKQINIDENEDTFTNAGELESILNRGKRLQEQMAKAIEPSKTAWEEIHGIHNIPKSYVPPFMTQDQEPEEKLDAQQIKEKIYDLQIEDEALGSSRDQYSKPTLKPRSSVKPDYQQHQNLESLALEQEGSRQIKDMKFIRIKIRNLSIDSPALIQQLTQANFALSMSIPLPDMYQKAMSQQKVTLSNYEILADNLYAFNSLSLYNFRVDEQTLPGFVSSEIKVEIKEHEVTGTLNMNKILMCEDFKLNTSIRLDQKVTQMREVKVEGRKKLKEELVTEIVYAGELQVEINLQSGDTEDEMKRNFGIKMQQEEEKRVKEDADKAEQIKRKMQFVMEQQPVFAQLYLNIDKLGENDNIGLRSQEQQKIANEDDVNKEIRDMYDSSLNNRATGTEEGAPKISGPNDTLAREGEEQKEEDKKIVFPKRNLYVQFKAFPNLEQLKTNTVWQRDGESEFNYNSQFPVLMCPETLEKMETFTLVLELWDQISPSVQEFLGLVKIPLNPIVHSIKTTDEEIYSLNFLADQFCMYPMTICDGYLPIYSPKLGQNIAHLKVNLSIGSPIQVNRLIQRSSDEQRRKQRDEEERKIREAEYRKEQEMKAARKAKKEKKRQLEEDRIKREAEKAEAENEQFGGLGMLLGGGQGQNRAGSPGKQMALQNLLRQSLNSQIGKKDYDHRGSSQINSLRKMFEESRINRIDELNSEEIFKEDSKNFDGTVQREEVLFALLNNDKFSLTRIEISQILQLVLDINRDDQGRVDVDELHFSFKSYIKYYELIEQRIIDMLEKFKISISKKFEIQDLMDEFVAEIESKAEDSKMSIMLLREIIEDRHGIFIIDAIYDQFQLFFDLDRNQQVYITSLCEYIRNKSSKQINFFKVNSGVITNQISEYIKNSIETTPNSLSQLEDEFKQEIWKNHQLELQQQRGEEGLPLDPINVRAIPADLLINEKVNAKLFQFKMKRMGIALSLWEVFTLFEMLNYKFAKMHFEPQRYHHIMFSNFYTFVTGQEYNRETAAKPQTKELNHHEDQPINNRNTAQSRSSHKKSGSKDQHHSRKQTEGSRIYNIEENGYNYGKEEHEEGSDNMSEKGYWHRNDDSDTEDPRRPYKQIKHIFEIKVKEVKNIPLLNKFICQSQSMADQNMMQNSVLSTDPRLQKIAKNQSNKYIQNVAVKYSFPLDEDEILESDYLQLNNESLDKQGVYNYLVSMDTVHTYILSKEDKIKNVLELCQSRGGAQNAALDEDLMNNPNQNRKEELFNISIALFQDNREYIIGNAHLPIEDLVETISQFEGKHGTYDKRTKRTLLNRTLFLYGTTYSQRENCIIGKLTLEVNYSQEKLFLSKKEAVKYEEEQREQKKINFRGDGQPQAPYSCFMHRETYINRKIPLNAKLSVLIDRVSHLKESIENIEHFHKIQHSAMGFGLEQEGDDELMKVLNGNLSSSTMVHNRADSQHLDRRRVLHHILKNGMNLIVMCSMFEEDQELVKKFEDMGRETGDASGCFGKYQTRMLYNSLNPVFGEVFEMNLQMDTKIFEYLKNKRAVFEVRHYIVQSKKQKINKLRESQAYKDEMNNRIFDDDASEHTIADDDVIGQCDYIVIGYVRVPMLQLITKNNGVDGDFSIFDEFKQKMGSLKLRITLNHHNSQRPLYSTSSKIPNQVQPSLTQTNKKDSLIDKSIQLNSQMRLGTITRAQIQREKYILGINFIELILKNKFDLAKNTQGLISRFFLKYRMHGQVYQTKFIGADTQNSLDSLNILLQKIKMQRFTIDKSHFIDLDMMDQDSIENAFGKPLEIQLWHKIESVRTYEKAIKEEMIGQFFVELNELPKIKNSRIKENQGSPNQPGKFQVYEGYFSMHETKTDRLSSDRLGMRLYLFNKDETNETLSVEDLNEIFNNQRPQVEQIVANKIDKTGKGYADQDELISCVQSSISDEYLAQKLIWFIKSSLEYKNVDKIYYSPLFGLPPPFFKYAKKFDQIEIVCRFCEELENLDSLENGFVPTNIFKNVLEGELNLKTKIVDDFINSLRNIDIENQNPMQHAKIVKEFQTLDVNLVTNSLKTSHVDYIVLLRKLSQFMEQNKTSNNMVTLSNNKIIYMQKEIEEAQEVVLSFEIDNGMGLKNPLSTTEMPNCYVCMKPNFLYKEQGQFLQTNVIKNQSYPMWNFKSYNYTMPLTNANVNFIQSGKTLEFEIFHKAVGASSNNLNVQESNHLVGVAFVPLTGLLQGNGRTRVTGMFDIVSKDAVYQSINTNSSLKDLDNNLGKIKVCINAGVNIKRVLEEQKEREALGTQTFIQTEAGPIQNLRTAQSFGWGQSQTSPSKSMRSVPEDADDNQSIKTQSVQHLEENQRVYSQNLAKVTEQQLDVLHNMNMLELEEMNNRIRQSMSIFKARENENTLKEQSFGGHSTFKTDVQRSQMTSQMKLNQATAAAPKNPFASLSQSREDEDDITRHEEPVTQDQLSQITAKNFVKKVVEHEEQPTAGIMKKESPTFKLLENDLQSEDKVENVFEKDMEVHVQPSNEETFYDLEEMQRIENIIKDQKK